MVYNRNMIHRLKHIFARRWVQITIALLLLIAVVYFLFFRSITLTPQAEGRLMADLERTKKAYQLAPFTSDGCSGGVSKNWQTAVENFSQLSDTFADEYAKLQTIPFESACIEHDRFYHAGIGGYAGRLEVDNQLRLAIIQYGIDNASSIQARTSLATKEQAIYLYELIAEAVYRGVRLGGAPCTEQTYAWGFGYNRGSCAEPG